MAPRKVLVLGAGFLSTYVSKALISSSPSTSILLASRTPDAVYNYLKGLGKQVLEPQSVDIRIAEQVERAMESCDAVVSCVGILTGSKKQFEDIQVKGIENIAAAAKRNGARIIHISAIGADAKSSVPYAQTKAIGEQIVLSTVPNSTILRPSLLFGKPLLSEQSEFFTRFKQLGTYLPFLPVFGDGLTKFQPVHVGDVAKGVEILLRGGIQGVSSEAEGKIIECGGPEVFTYREMMDLVKRYAELRRPIVSIPWMVGLMQGFVLERLPENLFTVTRDQVKQLKIPNVVNPPPPLSSTHFSFPRLLSSAPPPYTSSAPIILKPTTKEVDICMSVHSVLPTYLGPKVMEGGASTSGKRNHGRSYH